ncbi:MAG: lytic transglycosylase domain-containing protein, partial [Alphaproteobacteria bacterium]|nr:lytic transglycosylase domain-containing protein [Alphaproteobacteria bacterium]
NAQRVAGRDSGMSGLRMEDLSRRLVGGNVTREKLSEDFVRQQDLLRQIQSDPQRKENAKLQAIYGISAFGADGKPLNNVQFLSERWKHYQGMSDAQVQAEAQTQGLDRDVALSLKRQSDPMTPTMTQKDVDAYQKGADSTAKFNDELAQFNENLHELAVTLGTEVLPKMDGLLNKLGHGAKEINDGLKETPQQIKRDQDIATSILSANLKAHGASWSDGKSDADYQADVMRQAIAQRKEEETKAAAAKAQADKAKNKPTDQDAMKKTFASQDASNVDTQQAATTMLSAAQLFQMTVNGLTGALTQSEIMGAMFAGQSGGMGSNMVAGANVGGAGRSGGKYPNVPASLQPLFDAANRAHGFAPGTLEGIASRESTFKPNAVSGKGAQGLMQVMPSNSKALGVSNPFDAAASINSGGQVYADMLKRAGGDPRKALAMYNAGTSPAAYNKPGPRGYADDVLSRQAAYANQKDAAHPATPGATGLPGAGLPGQLTWQQHQYAEALAKRTGEPITQIVNQGVNKGDMAKLGPMMAMQSHNDATAAALKAQGINAMAANVGFVPNGAAARAGNDWRVAAANENAIRNGLDSGMFQRDGGATAMTSNIPSGMGGAITINAPINISGVTDPQAAANHAVTALKSHFANAVNQNTTQVVR